MPNTHALPGPHGRTALVRADFEPLTPSLTEESENHHQKTQLPASHTPSPPPSPPVPLPPSRLYIHSLPCTCHGPQVLTVHAPFSSSSPSDPLTNSVPCWFHATIAVRLFLLLQPSRLETEIKGPHPPRRSTHTPPLGRWLIMRHCCHSPSHPYRSPTLRVLAARYCTPCTCSTWLATPPSSAAHVRRDRYIRSPRPGSASLIFNLQLPPVPHPPSHRLVYNKALHKKHIKEA